MIERPIKFSNRKGCLLFGMLYVPDAGTRRDRAILVSVNAIKYRIGTFRMHVSLARRLCQQGYTVMTFDPEGVGDSEGEFTCKLLSEHYYDIQTGKYDSDLYDAIRVLIGESGAASVVLLGLCGGAISVLTAGAADQFVSDLILLNIPVLVEDRARMGRENSADKITSTQSASNLLRGKLVRLLAPGFWKDVITLKVDVREEWSLVSRGLAVLIRKGLSPAPRATQLARDSAGVDGAVSGHRLYNIRFQEAFYRAMRERKPVLFLFAEHDPWTWIFKSEFQDSALPPGNAHEDLCTVKFIGAANHIFSSRDSQQQVTHLVETWLGARS